MSNKQIFVEDLTLVQLGQSGLFTVLTDKNGNYTFTSTNTGNFSLWVDIPYGQSLTAPEKATGSLTVQVSGDNTKPINFEFYNSAIKNNPPVVTLGNISTTAVVNTAVNFTATFTDSDDGGVVCASSPPTWDFGDGTPTQTGLETVHTYTAPGTYTATIKVVDKRSGIGQASATITVAPPPKPEMKVSTSAVNFGDKIVNSRNYQYVTVSNVGNAPLQTFLHFKMPQRGHFSTASVTDTIIPLILVYITIGAITEH